MSNKVDIQCPFCKAEFEAFEWEDGECPRCEEAFYWDEAYSEDNFIALPRWVRLDRGRRESEQKRKENENT